MKLKFDHVLPCEGMRPLHEEHNPLVKGAGVIVPPDMICMARTRRLR
jgi:hypothetical protein